MGIQILGNGGTIVGAGEEARKPLHMTRMPAPGNTYRYAGFTGTIGAALAANSELLQFRFLSSTKTKALVHSVRIDGIGIVAVATAAGPLGWNLIPARAWTAAGSGGTRISLAGNNLKTETSIGTSQVSDLGIATTGALTAGTKTLDTNAQGQCLLSIGTGAATVWQAQHVTGPIYLFDSDTQGGMPLTLGNQEGFSVRTTHAGPAGLTYAIGFTVVWSEVTAF